MTWVRGPSLSLTWARWPIVDMEVGCVDDDDNVGGVAVVVIVDMGGIIYMEHGGVTC